MNLKRKALITGITGQDGSYLAELLLEKGYEVHGIVRRVSLEDPIQRLWRIRHILDRITLHGATLESYSSLYGIIDQLKPDELYHLGAQSFVPYSFEDEFSTMKTNVNSTHYILKTLKEKVPHCRFYFAGSSEMFGQVTESPQNEQTAFRPCSPYGISKATGFGLTRYYRQAFGLYSISGILFNHESPRRGFEFVTRKITSHAAMIKLGLCNRLRLGDISVKRDWGHAKDYVQAIWLMMSQEKPDDYVIATGKNHSVKDFIEAASRVIDLDLMEYVEIDPTLYRPTEVSYLVGNASKAKLQLGWQPSISFEQLVQEMVEEDLKYFKTYDQVPRQV